MRSVHILFECESFGTTATEYGCNLLLTVMPLHDLCLRALLVYPQLFLRRYVRLTLWEKDRWTKEALQGSALL